MQSLDFSKCRYNPLSEDFWEHAKPELGKHGSENAMRWIVATYDPNSPLLKKYPSLKDRRAASSQIFDYEAAGLETEAIIAFLKVVNSRKWASIVAIETALWEQMEVIMKPIEFVGAGQDKDKLAAVNMKNATAESIVELNAKLDSLMEQFQTEDKADTIKTEKTKRPTRPEDFAKAANANK